MYENILIPIHMDRAGPGNKALDVARSLATNDARLTLLNVIEKVPAFATAHLPEGEVLEEITTAQAALKRMAAASEFECDVKVLYGEPHNTTLNLAEAIGADCIIIESHHPELADYFFGSTAARVVRHARASVHVIR